MKHSMELTDGICIEAFPKTEQPEKIIEENNTFLENLKSREFLEQYARETYYMQNPNEQIYIIE